MTAERLPGCAGNDTSEIDAVTWGQRNVMLRHNHVTRWEDANDDTGTLLRAA